MEIKEEEKQKKKKKRILEIPIREIVRDIPLHPVCIPSPRIGIPLSISRLIDNRISATPAG